MGVCNTHVDSLLFWLTRKPSQTTALPNVLWWTRIPTLSTITLPSRSNFNHLLELIIRCAVSLVEQCLDWQQISAHNCMCTCGCGRYQRHTNIERNKIEQWKHKDTGNVNPTIDLHWHRDPDCLYIYFRIVIIRIPFLIYVRLLLFSVYILAQLSVSVPAIIIIYFMHVYTKPSILLYIIIYHVREMMLKLLSYRYRITSLCRKFN